ncbi:stage II sporulation protein M [Candidatus Woesearchaeota archaeon]|nr:stage II sporulation protein M [Candidatus Woesearchaeota archaeon]
MVLEQVFKAKWLEKRPLSALFLGLMYAVIGIISAKLIFPGSTSLMTVAFTSILLVPSLNRLLSDEENVEIREQKFSIKLLIKDHRDIFEIYFFMFIGVFLAYALFTLILPQPTILSMFSAQLKVAGFTGKAFSGFINQEIIDILLNNLLVMIVCLILSIVYGAGSILFLVWNASVWGAVFGYVAHNSFGQTHPLIAFGAVMAPVLAHMITEAMSYFSAAIVGGIVSKAVMREDLFSEKFHHILSDAMILLLLGFVMVAIAAVIEVMLYPYSGAILIGFVMLLALIIGALEPTNVMEKEGTEN